MSNVRMKMLVMPPMRGPKKALVAKTPAGESGGGEGSLGEMAM